MGRKLELIKFCKALHQNWSSSARWQQKAEREYHFLLAMSAWRSCLIPHTALMGYAWCLLPFISLCLKIPVCLVFVSPVIEVEPSYCMCPLVFHSSHFDPSLSSLFPVFVLFNFFVSPQHLPLTHSSPVSWQNDRTPERPQQPVVLLWLSCLPSSSIPDTQNPSDLGVERVASTTGVTSSSRIPDFRM